MPLFIGVDRRCLTELDSMGDTSNVILEHESDFLEVSTLEVFTGWAPD